MVARCDGRFRHLAEGFSLLPCAAACFSNLLIQAARGIGCALQVFVTGDTQLAQRVAQPAHLSGSSAGLGLDLLQEGIGHLVAQHLAHLHHLAAQRLKRCLAIGCVDAFAQAAGQGQGNIGTLCLQAVQAFDDRLGVVDGAAGGVTHARRDAPKTQAGAFNRCAQLRVHRQRQQLGFVLRACKRGAGAHLEHLQVFTLQGLRQRHANFIAGGFALNGHIAQRDGEGGYALRAGQVRIFGDLPQRIGHTLARLARLVELGHQLACGGRQASGRFGGQLDLLRQCFLNFAVFLGCSGRAALSFSNGFRRYLVAH